MNTKVMNAKKYNYEIDFKRWWKEWGCNSNEVMAW